MFAKVSTVLALFAVAAQVVVATPPACLLAAVNTQSDPSDIKSVCTGGASTVQKYMSSNCGGTLDAATSAFVAVCKDAGVTVASSTASSSSKPSGSESSTPTGTKSAALSSATLTNGAASGFQTQTTNGGGHSAPSATGASHSGSGSGTDAAGQPSETGMTTNTGGAARLGTDMVGLAALGLAGFMLAM